MKNLLKKLAARLPAWFQHELRRGNFAWSIAIGRFRTNEHEFEILDEFVKAGDWALDIGANVGHYAFRLSRLVGERGRVIAMEPVPDTFAILAETARRTGCRNVTLINTIAQSDPLCVTQASISTVGEPYDQFTHSYLWRSMRIARDNAIRAARLKMWNRTVARKRLAQRQLVLEDLKQR